MLPQSQSMHIFERQGRTDKHLYSALFAPFWHVLPPIPVPCCSLRLCVWPAMITPYLSGCSAFFLCHTSPALLTALRTHTRLFLLSSAGAGRSPRHLPLCRMLHMTTICCNSTWIEAQGDFCSPSAMIVRLFVL